MSDKGEYTETKIKKKERKYKRNVLSGGNLKRERERRKKDVYNLGPRDGSCVGPDMQKRGCRTELEYPRGLIWISISLRGQFSSRCFLPPGAVTYVSACTTDSQVTIGRRGCCRTPLEHRRGEGEGEKRRARRGAPLKIRCAYLAKGTTNNLGRKGSWTRRTSLEPRSTLNPMRRG